MEQNNKRISNSCNFLIIYKIIDRKYIHAIKIERNESLYKNFFFYLITLAIVDKNYKFISVHMVSFRKDSDFMILRNSL